MSHTSFDPESAVRDRYSAAAGAREEALCCPVSYDPALLEILPEEVLQKDYGCGDPTRLVRPGEIVLDLGSGAGKACFLAAQIVGQSGRVIGVDFNDEMLAVARRAAPVVAERLGFSNVEFRQGRIQDLKTDPEAQAAYLAKHAIRAPADVFAYESHVEAQRRERPLVADESVDVIVSNCVLNLVRAQDKEPLFSEMFRVLKRGGRAIISDIVSDEEVPEALRRDAELWSGCISGAFREDAFLDAFERAGFYGIRIEKRDEAPWRTVQGIEFRSLTVAAYKGKEGPCLERNQAVIYRGPFRAVEDDDGRRYRRGVRAAVCDKIFRLFGKEPYASHFEAVEPRTSVPMEKAKPFDCTQDAVRSPEETKGAGYRATDGESSCGCGPSGCCS